MNAIKYCRLLRAPLNKSISHKNVRFFGGDNKVIDVEVNGKTGVSTVTMQKPPVNSLSLDLVNELTSVMMQIEKDKGRGMVITSSIPGIFSAGLDLMEFYKPNQDRLKVYWTALQDMWLHLYSSSFPTAVAITGHSPAGGCLVAVSCDYRVMVQGNYSIGLNESQLGLAVPSWFVDSFRNVVHQRQTEMALMLGKLFTVDEALKVGLIDEVATDGNDAMTKALGYISKLSRFNMGALAQTKMTIRYDAIKRLQENREHDLRMLVKFVNMPEVQKALEMYIESLKKKK